MAYADDLAANQSAIIGMIQNAPTLNDFVIAYRNGLNNGYTGPDLIKDAFVKETKEVPTGKVRNAGFGRYEPETTTQKVYYTDAEIKAMSPEQINKLFMGGSFQSGFGGGVDKPLMAYQVADVKDPNMLFGIPQLANKDTRQTTFMHGLSDMTFTDAYNAIKTASPSFLQEQLGQNYQASQAVNQRRGLGAFMPGLIKSGAMAGFGAGIGNALGFTSGLSPIDNGVTSIADVIAGNSANVGSAGTVAASSGLPAGLTEIGADPGFSGFFDSPNAAFNDFVSSGALQAPTSGEFLAFPYGFAGTTAAASVPVQNLDVVVDNGGGFFDQAKQAAKNVSKVQDGIEAIQGLVSQPQAEQGLLGTQQPTMQPEQKKAPYNPYDPYAYLRKPYGSYL